MIVQKQYQAYINIYIIFLTVKNSSIEYCYVKGHSVFYILDICTYMRTYR